MIRKFPWHKMSFLGLFAIAFGWLEAVVVVYIRKIMETENVIDIARIYVEMAKLNLLRIEWTREFATIIILSSIALIVFKDWKQKIAAFLWTFGIWDIFYYISLKILISWPSSFETIDCLFLIPCPWTAPVWVPVTASILMMSIAIYLFKV